MFVDRRPYPAAWQLQGLLEPSGTHNFVPEKYRYDQDWLGWQDVSEPPQLDEWSPEVVKTRLSLWTSDDAEKLFKATKSADPRRLPLKRGFPVPAKGKLTKMQPPSLKRKRLSESDPVAVQLQNANDPSLQVPTPPYIIADAILLSPANGMPALNQKTSNMVEVAADAQRE